MFKSILIFFLLVGASYAKTVEMDVFARPEEVTTEVSEFDLLTLNGIRLSVTAELENLKLDSALFWKKLEEKKFNAAFELKFLKPLFTDIAVNKSAADTDFARPIKETQAAQGPQDKTQEKLPAEKKTPEKIIGSFKAELDTEKLKLLYDQLANSLEETKQKTFYILADIGIDSSMNLEDLGVSRSENFSSVIIDSWKKLAIKEFKNFENIKVLEKDFMTKPDYMNAQSVTLKWNSSFKKTGTNEQQKTAMYELNAQYVLVNTKSGTILTSFDFPVQKRELDRQNKKALSSALASLVYNLLLSQTQKIQSALEGQGATELAQFEFKITSKASLSEVYAINSLIQEKLKDFKPTSSVKSYSALDSVIKVEASGSPDQILDKLTLEGGKFPLNEQKILLFNRASKSFAIIPKDSNN